MESIIIVGSGVAGVTLARQLLKTETTIRSQFLRQVPTLSLAITEYGLIK